MQKLTRKKSKMINFLKLRKRKCWQKYTNILWPPVRRAGKRPKGEEGAKISGANKHKVKMGNQKCVKFFGKRARRRESISGTRAQLCRNMIHLSFCYVQDSYLKPVSIYYSNRSHLKPRSETPKNTPLYSVWTL